MVFSTASILNHIARYHKAPRQTERLQSGQTFQGSRDYPPVAQGKSPTSLGVTYFPRAVVSALRKQICYLWPTMLLSSGSVILGSKLSTCRGLYLFIYERMIDQMTSEVSPGFGALSSK